MALDWTATRHRNGWRLTVADAAGWPILELLVADEPTPARVVAALEFVDRAERMAG